MLWTMCWWGHASAAQGKARDRLQPPQQQAARSGRTSAQVGTVSETRRPPALIQLKQHAVPLARGGTDQYADLDLRPDALGQVGTAPAGVRAYLVWWRRQ